MRTIKMMFEVFEKKQKVQLFWLIIAILVGAVVELVSISSVLPFVEMVTDPAAMMEDKYIRIVSGLQELRILRVL